MNIVQYYELLRKNQERREQMQKTKENKKTYESPEIGRKIVAAADVITLSGNVLEEDYYEGNK